MPNYPKKVDKSQRRNRYKHDAVIVSMPQKVTAFSVPDPPKGLLKETREAWFCYWNSGLAKSAEPATDILSLSRLFSLYDERARAYKGYKEKRLVLGSQDQLVINPLGQMMIKLDAEIRQLEDRFGMTPRSRLQLGVTLGDAARSMRELNASITVDDEEDPR